MDKILGILTFCFVLSATGVNAQNYDALDVFEEYAVSEAMLSTEDMSLETAKNTPVDGVLKFIADEGEINVEIVTPPYNGSVTLTDTAGAFTYTPNTDYVGSDSFQFRISRADESSNISSCSITVYDAKDKAPDLGFVYEDMRTHWANYSAIKLVEADIIKGERVGSRYYFHPETQMRRIDVIEYILAALNTDFNNVDYNQTHIFADSAQLPEYINEAAYLANKAGFLEGVREGKNLYLNPYDYINRAEIIRMLDLAMKGKTQNDDELTFNDRGAIPDWAVQSVKNLVGYGIIQGFDDNTLRPYDKITKAQTAEMIYQMMKYNRENVSQTLAMRIKHEFYGKLTA